MSSLAAIRKYGFTTPITAAEGDKKSLRGRARQSQYVLATQLGVFDSKCQRIAADRGLSDEGRAEARKAVAKEVLEEIEQLDKFFLRPASNEIASLERTLARTAGLAQSKDPAEAIREMEVRQLFRDMDKGRRVLALEKAVQEGDELSVRAALLAPSVMGLFDARTVDEARNRWAAKQDPETTTALREAQELRAIVEENIADVRNGLATEAGLNDSMRDRIEASTPA